MELGRGRLGPARSAWSFGGMRISVRELGGGPAREMRVACFLHDPQVTSGMLTRASARTCLRVREPQPLGTQAAAAKAPASI
jgi:hypothetical protein